MGYSYIYFEIVALEEKQIKFISLLPSYVDTPLLRKLQENNDFDWDITLKPEQIADFVKQVIKDREELSSGSKIIIVTNGLTEDLEYTENLWGYNVDAKELFKLKQ